MELECFEEVKALTLDLVKIDSVNGNHQGEKKVSKYIADYFKKIAYFKKNKNQVFTYKESVIAYIKGKTNKTIILMGHVDTAGIDDYKTIKEYAFDSEKLKTKLKEKFELTEDILKDLNSGDYMFGRGILDMKSGVASNMTVMKYFANNLDELNGSLVFIAESDEEGNSKGIIDCLDILAEIKDKEKFDYKVTINTDFNTGVNSKDDNRYIHVGTVGKLLPSFLIFGKEAHVGNPFNGFDPNFLNSEINKLISYNCDFCDIDRGSSVPPVCLKMKDTKDAYTVQTALKAYSYYNYMLYNSSPSEVLNKAKDIAIKAFDNTINYLNKEYKRYCSLNKLKYQKLPWSTNVYTYDEWCKLLTKTNKNFNSEMTSFSKKLHEDKPNLDIRDFAYEIVNKTYDYYPSKKPVVVAFFASMFYANTVSKDKKLEDCVLKAIDSIKKETNRTIKLAPYYPYISDMSFMSTSISNKENKDMLANSPGHGYSYTYPYAKIKNINTSLVNIGVYGKDGHEFSERVDTYHSFKNVPNLTLLTIKNYLR